MNHFIYQTGCINCNGLGLGFGTGWEEGWDVMGAFATHILQLEQKQAGIL